MAKRILVNGAAGRIGRAVTRQLQLASQNSESGLELVALNDLTPTEAIADSYKSRDPVHGIYDWNVRIFDGKNLELDGKVVRVYAEKDITKIPLKDLEIDIVMECSGFFGDPKGKKDIRPEDSLSRPFLEHGAKAVIQTYPAKTADYTMIMGLNEQAYDPEKHLIISNASCTTKALAVPLHALMWNGVGIEGLLMDTTHAATASQKVLESIGQIITHSTGAAKATGDVIPALKGKMSGFAYRVPTLDGSFANLYFVANYNGDLTKEKVNEFFRQAVIRRNPRLGVFEGEEMSSADIVGREENGVVLLSKTAVIELPYIKNIPGTDINLNTYLVGIVSAYDNELASSVDPVLIARHIAQKMK